MIETVLTHSDTIFRLVLAAILGGFIGWEREQASFAGLRTHMLVCVGATLIMLVSKFGFDDALKNNLVMLDPSRVAAQVVSGIGFLGAGTILVWKNVIKGLTTAASLWAVAAVGLSIGGGLYLAASVTTVLILIILIVLKPIEKKYFAKSITYSMKLWIKPGTSLLILDDLLKAMSLNLDQVNFQFEMENSTEVLHLNFKYISKAKLLEIFDKIKSLPEIEKVEYLN